MKENDRWYKRIIRDARYNDRKRGRYIVPRKHFITSEDLFRLQNKQQNECYYCQCHMHYIERRSCKSGLTLERLNNAIPHYTSNCVLCCKSCNSKDYSREKGLLKRYFTIWKNIIHKIRPSLTDRRGTFA